MYMLPTTLTDREIEVFLFRHIMKPGKCSLVDGYYMFILRYASNGDWTAIARWVSMVLE